MARPKLKQDEDIGPGKAVLELFIDDFTGFSMDGIKLCFENALKARGYPWRVYVREARHVKTGEEEALQAQLKDIKTWMQA